MKFGLTAMGRSHIRRGNQPDRGKVPPIAGGVSRQQIASCDYGMTADKEVGYDSGADATGGAVVQKRLAGKEEGRPRHWRQVDFSLIEQGFEGLDAATRTESSA
jgi:hypothetical protein